MKLLRNLLLAGCVITSFSAFAETKIGVVDIRAALFSSDSAKAFSQKMEGEFKTQEMEVRAVQESGQKLQERIKKDAAIMSDTERTKLALQLEEKAKEFKYLKGKLDNAVATKKQEFIQSSKPKVDEVLKDLVESEKYDLIMPREAVIYSAQSFDVTAKVIEKLNALK
jgi:outer membrane protein